MLNGVIHANELAECLTQSDDIHLLDVRTLEEYQAYNIGGQHIPVQELMPRIQEVPRDKTIVVICRSGHRSQIAQTLLQQAGYADVRNLVGGLLSFHGILI